MSPFPLSTLHSLELSKNEENYNYNYILQYIQLKVKKMVPGKGKYANLSKGKKIANSTSAKLKEVKRERVSDAEDSDEETSLADIRPVDYAKLLPRFTSSNYFKIELNLRTTVILTFILL